MLSKKSIRFIIIFFLFFTFFPQLKGVYAEYSCNQSCALDPSGCDAPLTCYNFPPKQSRCRDPDCLTVVNCICPTNTPTPTPTPGPWIKLKNTSFISNKNLVNRIPPGPIAYPDGEDDAYSFFITDGTVGGTAAGLVAALSVNLSPGKPNSRDVWASYPSLSFQMTPSGFLSYVKARKEYKTMPNNDLSNINTDGIYFYEGDLILNNTNLNLSVASKFVLIVKGNVTIDQDYFNIGAACINTSNSKSIAILSTTGTISFSNITKCAAGIFIANTVLTGSTNNKGLKIKGNLVAQTSFANGREWINDNIPSLFIVFDQQKYLDLLPYLSTASYEWNQTQ